MICCKSSFFYNYDLLEHIKTTPFSKIYICKSKEDDIIKIAKLQKSYKNIYQIRNEIKILNYLNSTSITTTLLYSKIDYFNSFQVFEYINGPTLDIYLKTKLSELQKQNLITQLLDGFKYIQNKNIIHRDIKLDNIMIENHTTDSPLIKILDFGLSVYQKDISNYSHNEFAGSYQFACPEMFRGIFYNCTCDTWSLGVVFYCIKYNKMPYKISSKKAKKYIMFRLIPEEINKLIVEDILIKQMLNINNRIWIRDILI